MLKQKKLLTQLNKSLKKRKTVPLLWSGPESDASQGGVTQSLLGSFLVCRERFRLKVVEGLTFHEGFNKALEYGNMWHVCEEALASNEDWTKALHGYCLELTKRYKTEQEQVLKWYNVALMQFPIYVDYWAKQADVKNRTPLMQEVSFKVPYELPSKRIVYLRGKWDSVDLIGKGNKAGIWLQENKTKGDIKEEQLVRQLSFDLQTMFYLTALYSLAQDHPIKGIRYNVIRRPLSGGKGSIVQKKGSKNVKPETSEEYYNRLQQYIIEEPEHYFMRWKVEISLADIEKFETEFLDPILEQLCDWWEWISSEPENIYLNDVHWRHPYGGYNPMALGRPSEMDEYLISGSTLGLTRADNLFPELD